MQAVEKISNFLALRVFWADFWRFTLFSALLDACLSSFIHAIGSQTIGVLIFAAIQLLLVLVVTQIVFNKDYGRYRVRLVDPTTQAIIAPRSKHALRLFATQIRLLILSSLALFVGTVLLYVVGSHLFGEGAALDYLLIGCWLPGGFLLQIWVFKRMLCQKYTQFEVRVLAPEPVAPMVNKG